MTGHDQSDLAAERAFAESVLRHEAAAVEGLIETLGEPFHEAVGLIAGCAESGGTVLVSGLGKSGLVGSKISATFASLGIPSHGVHPTEAAHGDLGRFRASDTVICLSNSGETDEVVNLAAILHQDGLPIIAMTGGRDSTLARLASVTLLLSVDGEAGGPDMIAPTSTTTATLALGDALALAVARRRQFSEQDFAKRHPGGSLGGLLRPVTDVLRFKVEDNLVVVPETQPVGEALNEAEQRGRRPGALMIVNSAGALTGIFTDGDLRRLILRDPQELERPIKDVMTRNPRCLSSSAMARDAVRMVRENRQDEIPVVDADGRPVGLLDVQDLVAMKLIRGES